MLAHPTALDLTCSPSMALTRCPTSESGPTSEAQWHSEVWHPVSAMLGEQAQPRCWATL